MIEVIYTLLLIAAFLLVSGFGGLAVFRLFTGQDRSASLDRSASQD